MNTSAIPARRGAATVWHLLLGAVILASVIIQLTLVVRGQAVLVPEAGTPPLSTRVIRLFSFFTVLSNVLVAVTELWLVARPAGRGRTFAAVRMSAVVGITVTGVIYVSLLQGLVDLAGWASITNVVFHYVAPIAGVLGWLVFGPHPRFTDAVLGLSLIFPGLYVIYTLWHGAVTGWFPYPFVDAGALGWGVAIRNGVLVLVLLLGVGVLYRWLDRLLGRSRVTGRS
jgi:hypothetical protein